MAEAAFAIPGDVDAPTGGYAYDRRLLALLPRHGWTVTRLALPGGFPVPAAAALAATAAALARVPAGRPILVDGLAYGVLPTALLAGLGRRLVALVHHPLARETGLDPERAAALAASEAAALACAAWVVATGRTTAASLVADYGVAAERMTVAEPGTDPAPRAPGSGGGTPRLLALGALTPRKSYPLLVEALARLGDAPWTCHIVGSGDRDPAHAAAIGRAIAAAGLGDRVVLRGALDPAALAAEWEAADLFVTASAYEGYGMALAEALKRGLPVVASACDGLVRRVPAPAATVAPAGDAAALAAAIRALIENPTRRRAAADGAWVYGQSLPGWDDTAAAVAHALAQVAAPVA
ncbi:MAG TPA: glycosyltransferase family 4 protein [Hyphomicrobiales bacterium]|nr:glycosyltransferase family 4 protein [Hyphomicrobiales bacterium]